MKVAHVVLGLVAFAVASPLSASQTSPSVDITSTNQATNDPGIALTFCEAMGKKLAACVSRYGLPGQPQDAERFHKVCMCQIVAAFPQSRRDCGFVCPFNQPPPQGPPSAFPLFADSETNTDVVINTVDMKPVMLAARTVPPSPYCDKQWEFLQGCIARYGPLSPPDREYYHTLCMCFLLLLDPNNTVECGWSCELKQPQLAKAALESDTVQPGTMVTPAITDWCYFLYEVYKFCMRRCHRGGDSCNVECSCYVADDWNAWMCGISCSHPGQRSTRRSVDYTQMIEDTTVKTVIAEVQKPNNPDFCSFIKDVYAICMKACKRDHGSCDAECRCKITSLFPISSEECGVYCNGQKPDSRSINHVRAADITPSDTVKPITIRARDSAGDGSCEAKWQYFRACFDKCISERDDYEWCAKTCQCEILNTLFTTGRCEMNCEDEEVPTLGGIS
ncbi:hypothetical protein B0J11DRAFT_589510 [Dendryphion nanum]|uniref:Uncharacterized protein n=1 Tax=Dendryphion nanum TaxID=256645 RepID=A0A9P9IIQ5_9PLEO|nr:hypothetical protein B0J11DRAFT_589510 [Dendryphion nanum]